MRLEKEVKKRILIALWRYYLEDITFERAAEEANVPLYIFIRYVNDNNLPLIHTPEDVSEGLRKVIELMKKEGMEIKLPMPTK